MNQAEEKTYWEHIWDKFRSGDRKAFEIIYNEYIDALYSYGARITTHKALLEDAIQDLFLDVYKYGKKLNKPESLEFYLYKTLRRIIIRKLKEKHKYTHPEQFEEHFNLRFYLEDVPTDNLEEHIKVLQKELVTLDAKKRELLYLKFTSGLTYKDIGVLFNCKPDTVKKQVARILKHLQGRIRKHIIGILVFAGKK